MRPLLHAVPCSYGACRRTTKDHSGRCHHHRAGAPSLSGRPSAALTAAKPATSTFESDGLHWEEWKGSRGRLDRIDGPATIATRPDGTRAKEWWARHGQEHRVDGPAYTEYGPDGVTVVRTEWWCEGTLQDGVTGLAATLRSGYGDELAEQFAESGYRELLDEGVLPSKILDTLDAGVWSVEGVREIASGTPVEWVRSYEEGRAS